ncbi:flagellar protein FlaG [Terrarubrum flagellatum]|uniref:flagellar protein FlaG n=1 Tax=Terrirubrum flagellatum TaxID=2895980 RepID=UPI003144F796
MDGGAIPRVAPAPNQAVARSDSIPAQPSAPVDSPPTKVVQPVGEDAAVRLNVPDNHQRIAEALSAVDRHMSFDHEANEVVVTWVEGESGDVVHQFPTEQALKLRAYWREQAAAEAAAHQAGKSGDIIV